MSFIHQGFGRGRRLPVLEQYTSPDGTRFYNTPTGEKYPSVTTILSQKSKASIDAWRQRVGLEQANTIARVAAGRGTGLHLAAENYLNNRYKIYGVLTSKNPNRYMGFRAYFAYSP
jgi:hypothetical protein